MPEQWSLASSSQTPLCELPVQVAELEAKASAGQEPEAPVHCSATSHWPLEPRHVVAAEAYTSTQELAVPEQWSLASSSQMPLCELPVQLVELTSKTSAGQVPEAPVHSSATSH